MFALRVDLLSGRYVATQYNDRDSAEWPPHPARLFSALVAAWAEYEPDSAEGDAERRALAWLEAQSPPSVVADLELLEGTIGRRTVCTVFVPVNDTSVVAQPSKQREELDEAEERLLSGDAKQRAAAEKAVVKARAALAKRTGQVVEAEANPAASKLKEAREMLPEARTKQARTFPSVTPSLPEVELHWREAALPDEHRAAMERLLGRVSRLGHSSSFVACRIIDVKAPPPVERVLEPRDDGEWTLRWVSPGQTERLVSAYERHRQVEPRVMPCTFVSYGRARDPERPAPPESVFDARWVVLARVDGARLPITSAVGVAKQMNRALQSAFGARGEAVPELVSGHTESGAPTANAHLAVVPLPFVGSEYADGSLLGLALVLPRAVSPEHRAALLRAVGQLEDDEQLRLHLGEAGDWVLERVGFEPARQRALRPSTWTSESATWITATPIALDAVPGDLHHADPAKRAAAFEAAEASIASSVERIGLPRPRRVEASRAPLLPGAAKPRVYPRFPIDKARPQRVLVHARIDFDAPVRGPLLLGAGRYLGLGLCRPVRGESR